MMHLIATASDVRDHELGQQPEATLEERRLDLPQPGLWK
jgi:hypothetical protein